MANVKIDHINGKPIIKDVRQILMNELGLNSKYLKDEIEQVIKKIMSNSEIQHHLDNAIATQLRQWRHDNTTPGMLDAILEEMP